MTVEEWASRIIERELACPVVVHDDGSQPSMYDLRVGSRDAPTMAIECVGAVDSVGAELWNVGPANGPLGATRTGGLDRPAVAPDQISGRCPRCSQTKPIGEFDQRSKNDPRPRPYCRPCWSDYQRTRYLSVDKVRALNEARVSFVVGEDDRVAGLACSNCGGPIRVGQEVCGTLALEHTDCKAAAAG